METLPFKQLPLVLKIAVGVVFYNAWWSIEEFVIDRHGLWKYMPYYKVADPCALCLGPCSRGNYLSCYFRASTSAVFVLRGVAASCTGRRECGGLALGTKSRQQMEKPCNQHGHEDVG